MAEHSPVQLVPWPHVTLVRVVLGEQQPTSIDSLVNVKAESKKSTSVVVVFPLRYHDEPNQGGAKANKKTLSIIHLGNQLSRRVAPPSDCQCNFLRDKRAFATLILVHTSPSTRSNLSSRSNFQEGSVTKNLSRMIKNERNEKE